MPGLKFYEIDSSGVVRLLAQQAEESISKIFGIKEYAQNSWAVQIFI